MHIAASEGHLHVLYTLVKLGVAMDARNSRGKTPKDILKESSTTADYDMEIFKGISLIEIMEKYLAAEKGKVSLQRDKRALQNEHKKELKRIEEDQRRRDADSRGMKKEIAALKEKIKAMEEEHRTELQNVTEREQEKEAEFVKMKNEIISLKETIASRDEEIRSLEEKRREESQGEAEERGEAEIEASREVREQETTVSVLQDTMRLLQEQNTRELLSLRNEQHLKEAEAANQLRGAQEALKSRNKRVKALKRQLKEQEAECGRLSSMVEAKEIQINQLQDQLENKDRKVRTLQSRLGDKENQLNELEEALQAGPPDTYQRPDSPVLVSRHGLACREEFPWGARRKMSRRATDTKRSSQAEGRGRNIASRSEDRRHNEDPQPINRTRTRKHPLGESPQAGTGRRGNRRSCERAESPQARNEDKTPDGGSEYESYQSSQAETEDESPGEYSSN
ncbi:golgin subfamily A member 6-like protein 22 isoform X1 [Penaeus chinensis]|uniref:golgin subfamily A member 6-like protein 22 isoform X1 n=1 Tax=Penaeus chinensis TaxID=139456 RepID=UPI001FB5FAC9|nr:golgin subfamily A member 6-like protein 22 isoform X1 [Penaeus chinensis]